MNVSEQQWRDMQQAIDVAWASPEGRELRERLFPEGKPTVDLFVLRMAIYAKEQTDSTRAC